MDETQPFSDDVMAGMLDQMCDGNLLDGRLQNRVDYSYRHLAPSLHQVVAQWARRKIKE